MRTLQLFGPNFGLPDPSPFCMKAMVLLKMAGLDYISGRCDPRKAPKKKAPVLIDEGEAIPDTTFIRWHIEEKYGHDFNAGLSDEQKGLAWAVEKLCEDNIYWVILHERWMDEGNFSAGPRVFFEDVPMAMRYTVISMVRKQVKRDLWGHGYGRHSQEEIVKLGTTGLDALSNILGDKSYMFGNEATAADAIAFSTVASAMSETFDTPVKDHAKARANLVAYRDRCMERWFPDFVQQAQAAAE